jgi:hypothetical protein
LPFAEFDYLTQPKERKRSGDFQIFDEVAQQQGDAFSIDDPFTQPNSTQDNKDFPPPVQPKAMISSTSPPR